MSRLLVIAGPTGVGKSRVGVAVARAIGGEIVNFDSVQIYRGFDIGSAKPTRSERGEVAHHLLDIVDAGEEFHAAEFARRARTVCDEIRARGRVPVLVGGTYFYLRALLSGLPELPGRNEAIRARIRGIWSRPGGAKRLYTMLRKVDPVSASRVPPNDRHRVERALEVWLSSGRPISSWERPSPDDEEIPAMKFGLALDRPALGDALDARVDEMYRSGLVEEARGLLSRYPSSVKPFDTIGYREAAAVVQGEIGLADAIAETKRRTRAYAKRQMTWLRKEKGVVWLDASLPLAELVRQVVAEIERAS